MRARARVCARTYVWARAHLRACVRVRASVCVCAFMFLCACVFECVHVHGTCACECGCACEFGCKLVPPCGETSSCTDGHTSEQMQVVTQNYVFIPSLGWNIYPTFHHRYKENGSFRKLAWKKRLKLCFERRKWGDFVNAISMRSAPIQENEASSLVYCSFSGV